MMNIKCLGSITVKYANNVLLENILTQIFYTISEEVIKALELNLYEDLIIENLSV